MLCEVLIINKGFIIASHEWNHMRRPDLITKLVDDDSGVSPVIGVILMVSVTVIVAAVIGASALGFADSVGETPPQASFEFEESSYKLVDNQGDTRELSVVYIRHTGGESVDPKDITVTVDGDPGYAINNKTDESYPLHWGGSGNEALVIEPFEEQRVDGNAISAGDQTRLGMGTTYFADTGASIRGDDPDKRGIYAFRNRDEFIYDDGDANNDGDTYVEIGEYSTSLLESGDTIRIIYDANQDSSQVLSNYEVT